MPGVPWSEREDHLLRRSYSQRGTLGSQRSLAKYGFQRSREGIMKRARALGLKYDPTGNGRLVPIVDVHSIRRSHHPDTAHPDAVAKAEADGVLTHSYDYPHTRLVPAWWADQYAEELARREDERRKIEASWLTSPQAARLFGVRPTTLSTLVSPRRRGRRRGLIGRLVDGVETALVTVEHSPGRFTTRRYWNPTQVRDAARRYRAQVTRSAWHQHLLSNGEPRGSGRSDADAPNPEGPA